MAPTCVVVLHNLCCFKASCDAKISTCALGGGGGGGRGVKVICPLIWDGKQNSLVSVIEPKFRLFTPMVSCIFLGFVAERSHEYPINVSILYELLKAYFKICLRNQRLSLTKYIKSYYLGRKNGS